MKLKYGEDIINPYQLTAVKEKIRKTKLKLYENETYVNREKIMQTCLEKYGVKNASLAKEINDKKRKTFFKHFDTPEKMNALILLREKTCLEKYGVKSFFLTDECKELSHNEKSLEKRYNTKKKNHTFNSSKIELQFKEYLEQNYPNDFEYLYRSKLYPFNCDFYIKSLDLYIEILGTWMHGGHPYNEINDKFILELWKSINTNLYNSAIHTWTVSDVNKRNIAKLNKLNYLEIFSCNIDECIMIFNNKISQIS